MSKGSMKSFIIGLAKRLCLILLTIAVAFVFLLAIGPRASYEAIRTGWQIGRGKHGGNSMQNKKMQKPGLKWWQRGFVFHVVATCVLVLYYLIRVYEWVRYKSKDGAMFGTLKYMEKHWHTSESEAEDG